MTYILHLFFALLTLPFLLNRRVDKFENIAQPSCNYTLITPKIIINPYKSDIQNFVPQKPFGSFYLKCAACLAVAHQIGAIINDVLDNSDTSQIWQNSTNKEIYSKINVLCERGFKNYDLRKCNEHNIVTDKFKCTEHVKSNMDGGWTRKLREMCTLFTSYMDLEHISNIYVHRTPDLGTHLCNIVNVYPNAINANIGTEYYFLRGNGIFRDCQNLEDDARKNDKVLPKTCKC